jgi:hypothetical protein
MTSANLPIDHSTLPPWARWVAQDADGTWWDYEQEPNEGNISWYENEVGDSVRLQKSLPDGDWRRTLTKIR